GWWTIWIGRRSPWRRWTDAIAGRRIGATAAAKGKGGFRRDREPLQSIAFSHDFLTVRYRPACPGDPCAAGWIARTSRAMTPEKSSRLHLKSRAEFLRRGMRGGRGGALAALNA